MPDFQYTACQRKQRNARIEGVTKNLGDEVSNQSNMSGTLRYYEKAVSQLLSTGQATEHSYRPALKELIEGLGGNGVSAVNEPAHVECGAPDFVVGRTGVPIGHFECKNVGAHLSQIANSKQLKRYRAGLPNLVLTDYLEFHWYVDGELRETARLGQTDGQDGIVLEKHGKKAVAALFEGFLSASLPIIGDPRELAHRMASKARLLRDSISYILQKEKGPGPLHDLLAAYREVLITGLSDDDFADLQAQTAAYGLFAARCLHDKGGQAFTRQSAVFAKTTPFLRDVFGRIAGPGIDTRIAWIVDDIALLLDRSEMASILANFGRRSRREDPVVHFYEDFLAAYDPDLREMRGVYYTPEPVVSYIVRSIDCLLRDRFGLADGLAATVDGEGRQVLILDPAAGTGTFLREVVTHVRDTIKRKGMGGAWPDYVKNQLLPRLFGFELLMAPYAICHLKLALEIGGTEAGFDVLGDQRLEVFLTNTLEEPHERHGGLFAHEIAQEAAGADSVKRDKPVMVVLGNPPYSGHSANKGVWIRGLLRGQDGTNSTGNYFLVDGKPLGERNPKWINNDYVKFIRFAQWKIERTGKGLLGFVTSNSYLEGPTFRGMRCSLMDTFDEIWLLDLHGNAYKKEVAPDQRRDENVFDITEGVAIGLFLKRADSDDGKAKVFHADLLGECSSKENGGKYGWLASNDVGSTKWTELHPRSPSYLFVPRDYKLAEQYEKYLGISDIFSLYSVGIVTARDRLAIQWTEEGMSDVVSDFSSRDAEDARSQYDLGRDTNDWKVTQAQDDVRESTGRVTRILYRPFDERFTYYTGNSGGFICRPRPEVMCHMLQGTNIGLVTTKQCHENPGAIIANSPVAHKSFSAYSINYLFPLYKLPIDPPADSKYARESNLTPKFTKVIGRALEFKFIPDGKGDLALTFGPDDIFQYIYAVLHSPEYRRRYAEFLKSDFPRIPVTKNRKLFVSLVNFGERLSALHLLSVEGEGGLPAFPQTGTNVIDTVRYASSSTENKSGRIWINKEQYFEGVELDTWEFAVGGYRPAEKWLKDRKSRSLSFDDIARYRNLIAALAETRQIMRKIDEAIEKSGGWPLC